MYVPLFWKFELHMKVNIKFCIVNWLLMCKLWCMHKSFASKHWESRNKVHFLKNELIRSYLEHVKYVRKGGRVDKMSVLTFLSLYICIFYK